MTMLPVFTPLALQHVAGMLVPTTHAVYDRRRIGDRYSLSGLLGQPMCQQLRQRGLLWFLSLALKETHAFVVQNEDTPPLCPFHPERPRCAAASILIQL
mmetsp:Transcript_29644/g.68679  ORF Transcript_29644/g.68679 Transcript_29644/m.68679 type:complete len:99 (+) Transcript_29644:1044-1340(+)